MHIHLDTVGGIAGDMFLAACLDAWPELGDGARDAMRRAGLPDDWEIDVTSAHSKGLAGTRVAITPPAGHHEHPTGSYRQIRDRLEASPIDRSVRDRALDIFGRLAEAEAAAHGVAVDDVHFHEIADWDSVADIVGAAWLIETLDATSWSVSPLPSGSGLVQTQHGMLPVPTPAMTRLLEGYPLVDDGIDGERVTPTGAAIVAHLQPRMGGPGSGVVGKTGHGLGTRELPDRPNIVRLLAIESEPTPDGTDLGHWLTANVTVIEFDVDDQSPEDLAIGIDAIRRIDGVIDVVQAPVTAKKGRLATLVRVLCRPTARDTAIAECFAQTTTIGLRWRDENRAELRREVVTRDGVAGKTAIRPGSIVTAKPEIDALAEVAETSADRESARAQFTAAEDHRG